MTAVLDALRAADVVSALDAHFARAMGRLAGAADPQVLLAAALVSRSVRDGHLCVAVSELAQIAPEVASVAPPVDEWTDALAASPLVSDGSRFTPLVLDDRGRLYLARYWQHEGVLATALAQRADDVCVPSDHEAWARGALDRLFGAPVEGTVDLQRAAAATAWRRSLCVVSGGPGTGKTYTVVKILALLVEYARFLGRPVPRMILAAPTGKAAARMMESIRAAKAGLPCAAEVTAAIAEEAATIHRVLGSVRGSATRFRHHADNPLAADVVLVDEASMVDAGLMARLVAAVPAGARLILLGDKDQLASVEAGAALGDLCNTGGDITPSADRVAYLERMGVGGVSRGGAPDRTGIWDCIVHLTESRRYGADSGIRRLAEAINAGDASRVLAVLRDDRHDDVSWVATEEHQPGMVAALASRVRDSFGPVVSAETPEEAERRLGRFRILCAHRAGPRGVESVNASVRRELRRAGLDLGLDDAYPGRPIMVTQNSYELRLFNGDVGVLGRDPTTGAMRVYFVGPDGRVRVFSPARLPAHETVYAMTVHKSQGSEFDEVAIVLPAQASRVLSRELLYTAVTRARKRVVVYGSEAVIARTVAARVARSSGLRDALWEPTRDA